MNDMNNKIIILHDEVSNDLTMNLRYINEDYDFDRYFNFRRKANELCSRIIVRIGDNITKFVTKKLKKTKQNYSNIDVKVILSSKNDHESINLDKLSCLEAFVTHASNYYLKIDHINYVFDINPPLLTLLELPKRNIMASFFVYPSKIEGINCNINNTLFKWFKSKEKFENFEATKLINSKDLVWEQCGEGFQTITSNNDISRMLKVIGTPINGNRKGPDTEAIFGDLISPNPGPCPFERRHHFTKYVLNKDRLRVISYNILAYMYADSEHSKNVLYPSCPNYALDVEYRKQLYIKEILGYKADLICLQEVDENVFWRDLKPVLSSFGLEGDFRTKGGSSVTEGLAIFYRKEKLKLKEICYFVFSEELESNLLFQDLFQKIKENSNLYEKFKQRTNILQVSIFAREDSPSEILVIGSTHLYFEPYSDHIRLLQAGMALTLLCQIIDLQKAQNPNGNVAMIFCGDFNSTPENAVYRLMTTQLVDKHDPDWSSKPGEEVENVSFSHDLEIGSACGIPEYTNYTIGFNGCLDYIFYQADKFTVEQMIPFPTHKEVKEYGGLPSVTFPSDHISLVADLRWNPQ